MIETAARRPTSVATVLRVRADQRDERRTTREPVWSSDGGRGPPGRQPPGPPAGIMVPGRCTLLPP